MSTQHSAVSGQRDALGTLNSQLAGGFVMELGNLTAGELCWLGQLTELICDPARAAEWRAFKRQHRVLLYTEGALECVKPAALCGAKPN